MIKNYSSSLSTLKFYKKKSDHIQVASVRKIYRLKLGVKKYQPSSNSQATAAFPLT